MAKIMMGDVEKVDAILLVDDEEGIRKVLGISLADGGYQVLTAANGEEALRLFDEARPPIVLTDIKMPGMNGIDLLKAIKARNPEAEVIMITGHGDMDLAIESLKHEAADFITKPIDDEILGIALRRSEERIFMRRRLREYTRDLEKMVREQSARLVEAERLAAVGQVVDGFASALRDIGGDIQGGFRYFNELPCFVAVHDRDLRVMAVNQLYRDRLGDRVGRTSWGVYAGDSNDRELCPVGRTFVTGRGQRGRETVRFKDGTLLPVMVHTAPIKTGEDETALVLEISADITEVKRIQEELRATQRKYEQLFDEVPCYITVQDRRFRIVAANRRFKEDFGGIDGEACHRVYRRLDGPCPECPVAATFEQGRPQEAEMVVTALDGRRVNVVVHTAPILGPDGSVDQVMEVSTDITQIRELQDHLSSLGLLIGSISHGVKGLLTGLDGSLYRIDSGLGKRDLDEIEKGWRVVRMMVGRIRNMVRDVLYYAKERELNWERVDVLSLAEEVAQIVGPKMEAGNLAFVREFDPGLGNFQVDAGVVRSALVNILDNAVDACLTDTAKSRHRVVFRTRTDGDQVVFEIQDDGVGLDRETRENLFTLFYSSKGDRGTGLGLYISNKTVRRHGGSITVESEPGRGALFRVRIPKAPEAVSGEDD